MIKTTHSLTKLTARLEADFIADKQPLRDYAGFAADSPFAGQPRQSFSLVLPSQTVAAIRSTIGELYKQLIADCWPAGSPLPFDMVRFDAFLNHDDSLHIIELNTRNVGLHEIVEWLDESVGQALGQSTDWQLNKRFVANQKLLHSTIFGASAPLLFMSGKVIPKWKYYDEIVAAYASVCPVTSGAEYRVQSDGLYVNGQRYQAITRKFAWAYDSDVADLEQQNILNIVQPGWMRHYGHKNYLPFFDSPAILPSQQFTNNLLADYAKRQAELVLKIINAGGSKSVYLGAASTPAEWQTHLQQAAQNPELWVMQNYASPAHHEVIAHGVGPCKVPVQLGIFVLPRPEAPEQFDLDIVVKGYGGSAEHFTFDPSGLNPDIWFGQVIEQLAD